MSGCSLGRQGVDSALSRHAWPPPERLWKPHLTLPVPQGLSRETKVEWSVSLPQARETVSAGPRSERGRFLPRTSSSGLTLLLPPSRGKTSFGRHGPFPPSLCGLPALCIGLAKGLGGGLTERSLCFLVVGSREQVRLCPRHRPRATRDRRLPCFTCFNVDAT